MAAGTHTAGGSRRSRGTAEALRIYKLTPHHVFEVATAIVFALSAIAWLSEPARTGARSPIGASVADTIYPDVWSVGYLLALPLIAVGVTRSNRLRVAGLWLLGMALTMQFIAALSAPRIEPRTFSYAVFALACLLRALLLVKLTPRR